MNTKNHKLAAIVFTDIVGYTKQMEKNENNTMQLLKLQREIIFPIVNAHRGEVVKEIGDGLLIMFHSAIEAVRFAIETQERLKDEELTIRAGIHIGDVIFEGGDVFGSAVNTAARIEPLAPPNGICISEDVRNQIRNKDIDTKSIGKKELKGVNETLEIFKIAMEGVSIEESTQKLPFFTDLWKRRVIHILGAYLISSLIIIYIVSAIASSLLLSPHLVDFAWIALLSLSPTVFILSYFHAQKSRKKWAMTEKIGLPVNLIFCALLLILIFKGKELGATTTSIISENEDGEKIEKVVVKNEFRKKIAVFFFKNESKDTSLNWMQYAISNMIDYDLSQDVFFTTNSSFEFSHKLNEFGYSTDVRLPLTLKKKIANYYHLNYFLCGSFTKQNNEYSIEVGLYNTNTGKLLTENIFTGPNIFNLIDKLTIQLKTDLEIPESHLEEVKDLPLSEIYTKSIPALRDFIKGYYIVDIEKNWVNGLELLEKSTQEDPNFIYAFFKLAEVYLNANQIDKAREALEIVRKRDFILPETTRYICKYFYYLINSKPEKATAITKMWVELFPDDIKGRVILASRYIANNLYNEAISELKNILLLDPEQYDHLIDIGNIYVKMGEYDNALNYYTQYEKQFPKDYKSYRNIGYLHSAKGDYEKAKSYYEKALLLEENEISLLLKLVNIEYQLGNFSVVLGQYFDALKKCGTSSDSSTVYGAIESYFEDRGQIKESIKYMVLKQKEMEEFGTPINNLIYKIFDVTKYSLIGEHEKSFQQLKEFESQFDPPFDKLAYFGYLLVYLDIKDVANAEIAVAKAEELTDKIRIGELQPLLIFGQGRIHEINGDYEKAINSFTQAIEMQPTALHYNRFIGRCYRKLNKFKKAEEYLLIALKDSPFNPSNNYEIALLYHDLGITEKTIEYLEKANEIWKDADSNYKPAQKAKAKLEEVKESTVL